MSETVEARGRCLCGAVEALAKGVSQSVGACHCTTCRRWGGGPLLAVDCGREVTFTGEDQIGIYNSSDWAERGFCKQCGTHLFYRIKASGDYIMPAGLFGDLEGRIAIDQISQRVLRRVPILELKIAVGDLEERVLGLDLRQPGAVLGIQLLVE